MSHPFVLGKLALERRETYLKEAANHRIARQGKLEISVPRSLPDRLVARLSRLRIGLVRQAADQGRIVTSDAFSENKSKIPAG
jgi:hypothetical protein